MLCRRLLLLLVWTPLTYAQSGVLTGKVIDSHQVPVSNVTISLLRDGEKQAATTKTDAQGVYRFTVPGGKYNLRVGDDEKTKLVIVSEGKVNTVDLLINQAEFFDEPQFTVAGVTDNTYRGGHGSDTVLRSSETLAKETAALGSKNSPGDEYERSGHALEAAQEFQRMAEVDPSERNLFDWGADLLKHRAPQAAVAVFTKGVRLFPASVRMTLGVATAYYDAGDYEQAAKWFFKAADIDPSNPTPYLFLGKVQTEAITQSTGYRQRMERFARLQPNNALANYYYALCLWNSTHNSQPKFWLKKALTLDPHLGLAYLQLGIVDDSEQKHSEAIAAYRKAVDAAPDLEEAHYRLAEAYRITGDTPNSEKELATYRKLSKSSAEKVERERREIQQFVIALKQSDKSQ